MAAVRIPVMAGNWKMYKTPSDGAAFVRALAGRLWPANGTGVEGVQVVVAPPFTGLASAVEAAHATPLGVAAQNMFWAQEGAFTGEVSAFMLVDLGVPWVIIGHSERRQLFGETDDGVSRKVRAALDARLRPIVCVGETEGERERGETEEVLATQLSAGLAPVHASEAEGLVIAYEPVWAIGTGKTATPEIAQQAIAFVRARLRELFSPSVAEVVRILYGGSVKPENTIDLMAQADIDGALVGGASLDLEAFARIVEQGGT